MKLLPLTVLILLTTSFEINAQSNQSVSGYGTSGYLPKFSGNYILNNSQLFDNGTNVGIGTATPSAKLDITNGINGFKFDPSISTSIILGTGYKIPQSPRMNFSFNGDPNPALNITAYSHDNIAVVFDAYNNGSSWVSSHAGANFSLYKAYNELVVGYNSGIPAGTAFDYFNLTNGVRFGNNGSMGIGAAADATAKLNVAVTANKEAIRISGADRPTGGLSTVYYPALTYHASTAGNPGSDMSAQIVFSDRPGTYYYKDVVRTSDILLVTARSYRPDISGYFGAYADTTMSIHADQSGGSVGIGVNIPVNKLDVAGNLSIGSSYAGTNIAPANGLVVQGKVVIGTTDFSKINNYAFAVNGAAIFTKAVVALNNNWADYVFADDYKLLPISDLEKFIKKNKHLPEIPCASEVADNGIDLGETQIKLLKKIEELTLYVIAQNKQLAAQGLEMLEVKKEIALLKNK